MSLSSASAARLPRIASDQRVARHAGFWWGLAEGVAFFIVPDVYIAFAALYLLRAGAVAWLFSILGSLVAVCIVFVLVSVTGDGYQNFLAHIPGITSGLIETTGARMTQEGLPYTWLLILGGVPLKVYAALAFALGHSLAAVLLWTVFARFVRIAPVYLLLALVRGLLRRSIDARPQLWLALFVIVWVAFYAFYFDRMSRF